MTGRLAFASISSGLSFLAFGGGDQFRVEKLIDTADSWMGTWANDDVFVAVSAFCAPGDADRMYLDVHAGAAFDARPAEGLFEALATSDLIVDYGGTWARRWGNGVAYGWRTRFPHELFADPLGERLQLIGATIQDFGHAATKLADDLVPRYGGRRCRNSDPNGLGALMSWWLPSDVEDPAQSDAAPPPPGAPAPPTALPPPMPGITPVGPERDRPNGWFDS